ncbi:MAG: MFS transporter [bacterium]
MRRLFTLLYTVSGFCVLAHETIWIRRLGLEIGNTVVSATIVVTAFFLCAALGNLFGSKLLKNTTKSLRIYGLSEVATGISAMLLFPLAGSLYMLLHPLAGIFTVAWPIHLFYAILLVGPPAFFAGISFPALSEAFVDKVNHRTTTGGTFYAGNLIGAAIGVLGGGVLLPQTFGYNTAFFIISALYVGIGTIAIHYSSKTIPLPLEIKRYGKQKSPPIPKAPLIHHPNIGIAILICSGIFSIMLEMLVIAYFQQMVIGSLYVISSILFAFIINLGFGAMLASYLRSRNVLVDHLLLVLLSICGLLSLVYPLLLSIILQQHLFQNNTFGISQLFNVAFTTTIILAPLLIPIGTIFPLAWEIIESAATRQGEALGHAVAWNKAGSAIGALIGPFLLVPLLGLTGSIMIAGCGYLALAIWVSPKNRLLRGIAITIVIIGCWLGWGRQLPFMLHTGETLVAIYQGTDGVVGVVDDSSGSRHIVLNGTYTLNGTGRAFRSQQHESWIPLLLAPNPQRVAFIGMASGISADAALDYPISQLDAIELVPDVVKAAHENFQKWNNRLFTDQRASILKNDGRYVIQTATQPYNVVIIDLLHPALEGTASLYSADFLTKVAKKLTPDGICCLWMPMYQLNEETAGIALNTFTKAFPCAVAVRGNLDPEQPIVGLIGANKPINMSDEFLQERLQSMTGSKAIKSSPFLRSPANVRLIMLGDLKAISSDFEKFAITSDDSPAFAFSASQNIPDTSVIRGIKLLRWFGNRVKSPTFPSCKLGGTPPEIQFRAIAAGNNYFAASVFQEPLSDEMINSADRDVKMQQYLIRARILAPQTDITIDDLGQ